MDFNTLLMGSEDPRRLIEYYSRLFGTPQMNEGEYAGWQIGSGWLTVGPHSEVQGRNAQPGRLIWNIESSDVQGNFDRLVSAGAIVVKEPYRFDDWPPDTLVATLADPDDNYFQLVSPMEPPPA